MFPLRTLFSLLIISIQVLVCSAGELQDLGYRDAPRILVETGFGSNDTLGTHGLHKFSPLGQADKAFLFRASIKVIGKYYSGLVLIKKMPGDSAIHVVFLSELGLNLLDLSYRDDVFNVVSVQEFLNKPIILHTLKNDFRTLLLDLSEIEQYKVKASDDGCMEELRFKHQGERYRYRFNQEAGPVHIQRKKCLLRSVDFSISGGENSTEQKEEALKIGIKHRGVRLSIELKELKQL